MKKLWIILLLTTCLCAQPTGIKPILGTQLDRNNTLTKGIVGAWFNQEAAPALGTLQDISGNSMHGTLNNDADSVPGKFGNSLKFDGTNDYVDVGDFEAIEGVTELSAVMWLLINDAGHGFPKVMSSQHNGDFEIALTRGGTNSVSFFINSVGLTSSGSDWSYDEWMQLAVTYRSAETNGKKIYINGVVIAEATQTAVTDNNANSLVFADRPTTGRSMAGQIDHVEIYNRALTHGDIISLGAEPFQMFEQERLPIASAAAPAEVGRVMMIMGSVPLLIVCIAFSFWISERKAA